METGATCLLFEGPCPYGSLSQDVDRQETNEWIYRVSYSDMCSVPVAMGQAAGLSARVLVALLPRGALSDSPHITMPRRYALTSPGSLATTRTSVGAPGYNLHCSLPQRSPFSQDGLGSAPCSYCQHCGEHRFWPALGLMETLTPSQRAPLLTLLGLLLTPLQICLNATSTGREGFSEHLSKLASATLLSPSWLPIP